MFKHYFELIEGVAIWPIISLLIFFFFFLGVTLWAFMVGKDYVKHMKNLPLNEDSEANLNSAD